MKKVYTGIVLFILFLSVSLYQIYLVFDAPLGYGRLVSYLILFFSLIIVIFLTIGLLQYFTNFIQKSWFFYTFKFLMTLILPLIIISSIENKIQKTIFITVKNKFIPIISYIETYKVKHGEIPTDINNILLQSNTLENISYLNDFDTFILEIDIPTIDIDGAKIFYDSKDKQWHQFHNDEYQYYLDKTNRPKSIETYMSHIKQIKTSQSILIESKDEK